MLPGIKDIRIIIHLRLNDGLCLKHGGFISHFRKKNMLDFFFFSLEKNILVMEMFICQWTINMLNFGWNLRNIGNALRKSGFSKATLYVYLYGRPVCRPAIQTACLSV